MRKLKENNLFIFLYRNIAINKCDMGLTKTDGYSDEQNNLAITMKALAHPARLAIVDYILSVDSCICGDIVDQLPLSQPTISQHLKELKTAGIIKGRIEGNAICYCIDPKGFEILKRFSVKLDNTLLKSVSEESINEKCC